MAFLNQSYYIHLLSIYGFDIITFPLKNYQEISTEIMKWAYLMTLFRLPGMVCGVGTRYTLLKMWSITKLSRCNDCCKVFANKKNLVAHMRINSDTKPLNCGICNKQVNQASDLKKHMIIHTGEKSF